MEDLVKLAYRPCDLPVVRQVRDPRLELLGMMRAQHLVSVWLLVMGDHVVLVLVEDGRQVLGGDLLRGHILALGDRFENVRGEDLVCQRASLEHQGPDRLHLERRLAIRGECVPTVVHQQLRGGRRRRAGLEPHAEDHLEPRDPRGLATGLRKELLELADENELHHFGECVDLVLLLNSSGHSRKDLGRVRGRLLHAAGNARKDVRHFGVHVTAELGQLVGLVHRQHRSTQEFECSPRF